MNNDEIWYMLLNPIPLYKWSLTGPNDVEIPWISLLNHGFEGGKGVQKSWGYPQIIHFRIFYCKTIQLMGIWMNCKWKSLKMKVFFAVPSSTNVGTSQILTDFDMNTMDDFSGLIHPGAMGRLRGMLFCDVLSMYDSLCSVRFCYIHIPCVHMYICGCYPHWHEYCYDYDYCCMYVYTNKCVHIHMGMGKLWRLYWDLTGMMISKEYGVAYYPCFRSVNYHTYNNSLTWNMNNEW